jgi:acyl-coenzyme A thioesterase PaaI-like protein
MHRLPDRWRPAALRWLLNLYPPYRGAGVWVTGVSDDSSRIDVRMRLRFWNRNYVGTHFGGSLYSMADPHFVLIVSSQLGEGYVVWDKAASIQFLRPGRGTVKARFEVTPDEAAEIRRRADASHPRAYEPVMSADVVQDGGGGDEGAVVVARIEKRLYVRRTGEPRDKE